MTGRGPGGRSWIEHMMDRSEKLQRESDAAIETAKRLGTYDAIDRSKQYERADNRELLRAVNEAWSKIRAYEKHLTEKDAAILELRRKLERVSDRFWAVSAVVMAEAGVIGFLAKELFSRLH